MEQGWIPGAVPGPWGSARLTLLTTACPFKQMNSLQIQVEVPFHEDAQDT